MDKVLIAEDNPVLAKILKAGLKKYEDKFETITVKDGEEAINVLRLEQITLLITDLQMPKIDGLSLLAHMNENHPEIPCIVMTAHGTKQIKEKLQQDVLNFIEKPFEIDDLVRAIIPALDKDAPLGSLNGISIANFLQMIEMEQKTCLFEVNSQEGKGFFYFEDGVLYDAVFGDIKGLEAALKLIPMENVKIRFKNVSRSKKKIARRIKNELMTVIMEAMRLKDESSAGKKIDIKDLSDDLPEIDEFNLLETEEAVSDELDIEETAKEPASITTEEDSTINLKSLIRELKTINGYMASAIMNYTGEVLESDSTDPNIDLGYISAMFNDIFLSANKVCDKIGFEANLETTIATPKGIVIMRSSGVESRANIHVITILEPDGNQALMKMEMEKMMPLLVDKLI